MRLTCWFYHGACDHSVLLQQSFSLTLTYDKALRELESPLISVPLEPILMWWPQACWAPHCWEPRGQPGVAFGWEMDGQRMFFQGLDAHAVLWWEVFHAGIAGDGEHFGSKFIRISSHSPFAVYNANCKSTWLCAAPSRWPQRREFEFGDDDCDSFCLVLKVHLGELSLSPGPSGSLRENFQVVSVRGWGKPRESVAKPIWERIWLLLSLLGIGGRREDR